MAIISKVINYFGVYAWFLSLVSNSNNENKSSKAEPIQSTIGRRLNRKANYTRMKKADIK